MELWEITMRVLLTGTSVLLVIICSPIAVQAQRVEIGDFWVTAGGFDLFDSGSDVYYGTLRFWGSDSSISLANFAAGPISLCTSDIVGHCFSRALFITPNQRVGINLDFNYPDYELDVRAAFEEENHFAVIRVMGKTDDLLTPGASAILGADDATTFTGSLSDHDFVIRTNNAARVTVDTNGWMAVNALPAVPANYVCASSYGFGVLGMCSSSRRYKDGIQTLDLGMEAVAMLRPVAFHWKEGNTADLGFIAEEVAAVHPLLATYDETGQVQGVKYGQLTAVLVNAVNELKANNEFLRAELVKQRARIDALVETLGGTAPSQSRR
jgi:hypothetical protein